MEGGEPPRLLLDADLSSHSLVRILSGKPFDLVPAGFVDDLKQLDDPILPDILREWAGAGRRHHGCIITALPANAYGEMERRFDRWFERHPSRDDCIDRAVFL